MPLPGANNGECKLLCKTQFSGREKGRDLASALRFASTRERPRQTFAVIKKTPRRITGIFSAKMPGAQPRGNDFYISPGGQRKHDVSGIHSGATLETGTVTILLKAPNLRARKLEFADANLVNVIDYAIEHCGFNAFYCYNIYLVL